MKQTIKIAAALIALMAVSACSQTSQTSAAFSNYDYAPVASYDSYPTAYGYGYADGSQGASFNMTNHY